MPELPEVETIRGALAERLGGARVVQTRLRRRDLRFRLPHNFAARLNGRRILGWGRRAKYLTARLAARSPWQEDILFVHLGMSGRLLLRPQRLAKQAADKHDAICHEHDKHDDVSHDHDKHDHVAWQMETRAGPCWLIFRDPRRFGYLGLVAAAEQAAHARFRALGVEPLGADLTAAFLAARLKGARTTLKAFLLNQRHIAGLGNIYVCEALHRAGLHPAQPTRLAAAHAAGLRRAIRHTLRHAVAAGGSSLGRGQSNFVAASGEMGYFQLRFRVYGRAGRACRRRACRGIIRRFSQAGRSSFFCPHCQPAP